MVTTALCSSRMRAPGASSWLTTSLSSLGIRSSSTEGTQPRQLSRAFHPSTPKPAIGSYANRPLRVVRVGRRHPRPAPSHPPLRPSTPPRPPLHVVRVGPRPPCPSPPPSPCPATPQRAPLRRVRIQGRPKYVPLPAAWNTEPTPTYPRRPSPSPVPAPSPSSLSTFNLPVASPRAPPPCIIPHTPLPRPKRVWPRPPAAPTPVSLPSDDSSYILPDVPDTQFLMPDYGELPAGIIWRSPPLPVLPFAGPSAPASTLSPIRQPADYSFLSPPASSTPSSPDPWEDDGWVAPPETWPLRPPSLDTPVRSSPPVLRVSTPESPDSPSGFTWITSSPSSLNIHTVECSLDSLCSCPGQASPVRTTALPPRTPARPIPSFAVSSGDDRSFFTRVADAFTLSLSWLSHGLSTGISTFFSG